MTIYQVKFKDGTVVAVEADEYPSETRDMGGSKTTLRFKKEGQEVGTIDAKQVDGYWERP